MNTRKGLYLAVIATLFLLSTTASASTDSRYFVRSSSNFWKKTLAVHNTFDGGFTSDLSDWQLKLTKVFGVETTPIKSLIILSSPVPTPKKAVKAKSPSDVVNWGVKAIYGSSINLIPDGGADVTIAILDTGVSKSHPDLKNRISDCADFSTGAPFIQDQCDDKNGHGTNMAGIVAADGGDKHNGIYGMAPSASLAIYKVCQNDGICFVDDVAMAIRYAADHGAQIELISAGADIDSQLISDAVAYARSKGVLMIAAGGNDGPYTASLDFPATLSDVISVGAIDIDGNIAEWSARGNNSKSESYVREDGDIELVAPGVNIQSTGKDNDYTIQSGTSMSAAYIAGLAAKEWQFKAKDPAVATRQILHKFAVDILPAGDDDASGWGIPEL